MCTHLEKVVEYLTHHAIKEAWRGQPWTDNCREWIYYDAVLDPVFLQRHLSLDACIEMHDYSDIKAGSERGLFCTICKDGVMGMHPNDQQAKGKPVISGLS